MKYLIHKEAGMSDSKETVLQLNDGRFLCRLKEPTLEVGKYINMIFNHIPNFWNEFHDEKSLLKNIIDDEKRHLMIDPEDFSAEDKAFLKQCGGELKAERDYDGFIEMMYNGSYIEKYNGTYYTDAGDTMEMKSFDDSGIIYQITTYNMCDVTRFKTLSTEDTLKAARSMEVHISRDVYDKIVSQGFQAEYNERFGEIIIINEYSKYPVIQYKDNYYRCLTQLNLTHTLSDDGAILSAKIIKVYKLLFDNSNTFGITINETIQPTLNDFLKQLKKGCDAFVTLKDLEPVYTNEGKMIVNRYRDTVDFKMQDKKTNKLYALKAFLRDIKDLTDKYKAIESYFTENGHLQSVVIPKVYDNELLMDIETGTTKIPVVLTDWPGGCSLYTYVLKNYNDHVRINMLAHRLSKIFTQLRKSNYVHGNLNSKNIYIDMLTEDIYLYDYDYMRVPGNMKVNEGMCDENYSYPGNATFSSVTADDFAMTSILLSLVAIGIESKLFRNDKTSNALLFKKSDYLNIAKSSLTDYLPSLLENTLFRNLYSIFVIVLDKGVLPDDKADLLFIENPYVSESNSIYEEGSQLFEYMRYEEAAKKFKEASLLENVLANRKLGYMTMNSLVQVNPRLKAVTATWYYKRNLRQHDHISAFNLGVIYFLYKNYQEAVRYFKMSSIWGNAIAKCNLAYAYETGLGVEVDMRVAEQYLLCASESDNGIARSIVVNAVFGLEPYLKLLESYNDRL